MIDQNKKSIKLKGNTAIIILLAISLLLFVLLFLELVESKIILLIFAISLSSLGVLSGGFKKQNSD